MQCTRGTLSQSAQGAITEYHRLAGLNHRHLNLTVLEAKAKIKALAESVPGEGSLPGL